MADRHLFDPFMPKDPLMAAAWTGALSYALRRDDIMGAFRAETGNDWTPARSALDRMIDDATGAEKEFFVQFAAWFNENLWGDTTEKEAARA